MFENIPVVKPADSQLPIFVEEVESGGVEKGRSGGVEELRNGEGL